MNLGEQYIYEPLKDFAMAEEMFVLALEGYEGTLGMEHEQTKRAARDLLGAFGMQDKEEEMFDLISVYPHLQKWFEDSTGTNFKVERRAGEYINVVELTDREKKSHYRANFKD